MSYDWDHQRQYTIDEIIEFSGLEACSFLVEICVDMELHRNAFALDVYNVIITNPNNYHKLKDAAIHSMNNDGWVGKAGSG